MLFGGINGLNAFSPAEFQDNVTIPPVVVTALTQGGDALETAASIENVEEIILNWPANFFEFEFAALSYANPEENEYAYKLEGFDEDWNRVGSRPYGRYANLPGGAYRLRLIGSNNDGIWNEEGASLKVTVVPPFWSTWWFRGLGLLAILVVVVGGYQLRVRNVEARSRELESEVDSRTKELAALPKKRPRNLKRKPRAGAAQDLGFCALYTGRPRIGRDRRLRFNGWPGQVTLFQFVRYGIAWGAAVVILVVWKRRL